MWRAWQYYRLFSFGLALLVAPAVQAAPATPPRLALVIGEASYRPALLPTTANDAGLVAQALTQAGFAVTGYADLSKEDIGRAFADFVSAARQAGPEAVTLVYVSGYGLQFNGENFVVPVEADLPRDSDIPVQAVNLRKMMAELSALPLKARIAIFDLARAHPFARLGDPVASGLAMDMPPRGTIELFNTAPGLVVAPGEGDYSPFASDLAREIASRPLDVEDMVRRLRLAVADETSGSAVPFLEGALDAPLSFAVNGSGSTPAELHALPPLWQALAGDRLADYVDYLTADPASVQAKRVALLLAARREASIWAQTTRAATTNAIWTYMRRYPRGPHFADARRLLAVLHAPLEPPPRFELYKYVDVGLPSAGENESLTKAFVFADDGAPPPLPPLPGAEGGLRFFERLPPLLPVNSHALPLPFPRAGEPAVELGSLVEPGIGTQMPLSIRQGSDKSGPFLIQEAPDHRVQSEARLSGTLESAAVLTQTGPSGATAWTMAIATDKTGRTITQAGADRKTRLSMSLRKPSDGTFVISFAGANERPVATLMFDALRRRMAESAKIFRLKPQPGLLRPTVLDADRAMPSTVAVPQPVSPAKVVPAKPLLAPREPTAPVAPNFAPVTVPAANAPTIATPQVPVPEVPMPVVPVPAVPTPSSSISSVPAFAEPAPMKVPALPAMPVTPSPSDSAPPVTKP